ncbi:hypothetical protein [Pseudoalteromonas gelatinilytica]
MTDRKLNTPEAEQWLVELDAVIKHEVLFYLVESKVTNANNFYFDPWPFMALDEEMINALNIHLDKLCEAEDDRELAELIVSVGSLEAINATNRFLDEDNYRIQVIEKTTFEELSQSAKNALTNKYPIALPTIEFMMKETGENTLPPCFKSHKLNKSFSTENLWRGNELDKILIFHTEILKNAQHTTKKPELINSNKKFEFIEIIIEESNDEVRLITDYKLGKIRKLNNKYRKEVLTYCEDLVKHQLEKYTSGTNQGNVSNNPVPPPEKKLASRYDGYLPYIIGLLCITNKSKYKEIEGLEYEKEFDSFKSFVKSQLFDKFDYFKEDFNTWHSKNRTGNDSDDINTYITNFLTKRINGHIKKTQSLIDEYDELYFSDDDITN